MKIAAKILIYLIFGSCITISCRSGESVSEDITGPEEFFSPLGKALKIPAPSKNALQQYEEAQKRYISDSDNEDNIIWLGRRTAYLGKYNQAIAVFTEGIEKFPEDARLYRHRGHRYISIRKFDKAIKDLEKAAELINATENELEPDGIPNAQNIPISTLHGNIWYHLGLAYYLIHDYEKAYKAYLNCRVSGSNTDNLVSSSHWLYMIQRRLGNRAKADSLLTPINKELKVIENHNYADLCKFYKGLLPIDSLLVASSDNAASDAIRYGLANWYFYNNEREKSKLLMADMVNGKSWSSFGYIAAESDLIHYFR